ncbi:transposon-transfer assisting family protein [Tannockella kyphosi]|uniref:transposon-transfer assisting family protein n=1 Tax=Tannockella kyphosi TaxID=2899121 RepID=UPI002013982B
MKFTVEETNLMCIYGTDSRQGLIAELEEMQPHLQEDEVELVDLTRSTLAKLHTMSNEEFEEVKSELVADFE